MQIVDESTYKAAQSADYPAFCAVIDAAVPNGDQERRVEAWADLSRSTYADFSAAWDLPTVERESYGGHVRAYSPGDDTVIRRAESVLDAARNGGSTVRELTVALRDALDIIGEVPCV